MGRVPVENVHRASSGVVMYIIPLNMKGKLARLRRIREDIMAITDGEPDGVVRDLLLEMELASLDAMDEVRQQMEEENG